MVFGLNPGPGRVLPGPADGLSTYKVTKTRGPVTSQRWGGMNFQTFAVALVEIFGCFVMPEASSVKSAQKQWINCKPSQ